MLLGLSAGPYTHMLFVDVHARLCSSLEGGLAPVPTTGFRGCQFFVVVLLLLPLDLKEVGVFVFPGRLGCG